MRKWINLLVEYVEQERDVIDAAVPALMSAIDHHTGEGATMEWRIDQGRDPYEEGDDEDGDAFEAYQRNWCIDRLYGALSNIRHRFQGNQITVYRCISAPEDWQPDGRHPGIYWSWDKNAADAHWGDGQGVNWLMTAVVTTDQIDWVPTAVQNALSSYEDEREIRLKPDTPVHIIDWHRK